MGIEDGRAAAAIPWSQTYTGRYVPLIDPQPEHISIVDIAHQLAVENRFCGATFRPYSVAQHSVHVAQIAGGYDGKFFTRMPEARFGLLHDASEAYIKDIPSPLKRILAPLYQPIEDSFTVAILIKFGVDITPDIEAAVKRADLEALATEKRDLMSPEPAPWGLPFEPVHKRVEPLVWRSAEVEFLRTFEILFPEHRR